MHLRHVTTPRPAASEPPKHTLLFIRTHLPQSVYDILNLIMIHVKPSCTA